MFCVLFINGINFCLCSGCHVGLAASHVMFVKRTIISTTPMALRISNAEHKLLRMDLNYDE